MAIINDCGWQAPSNIALVKYWGKHGRQLPMNPSVSLTLDKCVTQTHLKWVSGTGQIFFNFSGENNEKFGKKIADFLHSIVDLFPFIPKYDFYFESHNSFPHSAGIASSASSMASVSLCLCTMAKALDAAYPEVESDAFYLLANRVARLGSGSACRSFYPQLAIWGKCQVQESSDEFAIPFKAHPVISTLRDTVLVIDALEKSVSSRVGHSLMNAHPFAQARFAQAKHNMGKILQAMEQGNLELFGQIVEEEALSLHATMMTSHPSYVLLKPNSLVAIEKVRHFRAQSSLPLFFTLDAGPNLHLLYPAEHAPLIDQFIERELRSLCGHDPIYDLVGPGPKRLK